MEAFARVQRVDGGRLWLKVSDTGGGCGRCDEPGGCRSVQIVHVFGKPATEFALPSYEGARVGDRVRIRIADGAPLRAALGSYGLAAALLVTGAAVGTALATGSESDLFGAIGAAAGLALAFVSNRLLVRSRRWRDGLSMEVVADGACLQASSSPVRKA
ncbi:MAG: Fis family transcriptional regulator [Betaproteobacteria bacterium]|nr:MAG: Fis family transcriptional regulator [Betaproteobacteria bacterium]